MPATKLKPQSSQYSKIILIQKTDQTLVDNVSLSVAFGSGSEQKKTGSGLTHDTTTNSSRIYATEACTVTCKGSIRYAGGNTTNRYETAFLKNGTGNAFGGNSSPASATSIMVSATADIDLAAGDYVELLGFQHTGGNITAQSLPDQTFFSVFQTP